MESVELVQIDTDGRENLNPPNFLPLQALMPAEDNLSSITLKTEKQCKNKQNVFIADISQGSDSLSVFSPKISCWPPFRRMRGVKSSMVQTVRASSGGCPLHTRAFIAYRRNSLPYNAPGVMLRHGIR